MENRRVSNHVSMYNTRPYAQGHYHAPSVTAAECSAIENKSLAMAYVPWQHWQEVYPVEKALECGTLFPELNKPFVGRR